MKHGVLQNPPFWWADFLEPTTALTDNSNGVTTDSQFRGDYRQVAARFMLVNYYNWSFFSLSPLTLELDSPLFHLFFPYLCINSQFLPVKSPSQWVSATAILRLPNQWQVVWDLVSKCKVRGQQIATTIIAISREWW